MKYPKELIANYKQGKITRQDFINQFSQKQKMYGLDFDVKLRSDSAGYYLLYRGYAGNIEATGQKMKIEFYTDKGFLCVDSVFKFCREIDFMLADFRTAI